MLWTRQCYAYVFTVNSSKSDALTWPVTWISYACSEMEPKHCSVILASTKLELTNTKKAFTDGYLEVDIIVY